jgi:nicotinate-nucleotide--dimethylbenzimidazole phosphoribosyltransferase
MVANFVAGGAAVNVLADRVGARVRVVDIAVAHQAVDVPADVTKWHVRKASGRIDIEDALTVDETEQAIEVGRQLADDEIDIGADLLIPGDMGIGNTTPAAVLIGVRTGNAAAVVTGRGTGIDDATLDHKRAVVAAAMARAAAKSGDPVALLSMAGGADIAAMAGFLAQAAVRRTPIVLDGVVSGAAALVAEQLAPGAKAWWCAGHRSVEPAHGLALRQLGLEPLVDLGLRLGEGTGALLAVPLLGAAADTLARMATFDEAQVSDRAADA